MHSTVRLAQQDFSKCKNCERFNQAIQTILNNREENAHFLLQNNKTKTIFWPKIETGDASQIEKKTYWASVSVISNCRFRNKRVSLES